MQREFNLHEMVAYLIDDAKGKYVFIGLVERRKAVNETRNGTTRRRFLYTIRRLYHTTDSQNFITSGSCRQGEPVAERSRIDYDVPGSRVHPFLHGN